MGVPAQPHSSRRLARGAALALASLLGCAGPQPGSQPKADFAVALTGDGPAPSCSDRLQNGEETDVDCGGPGCPPCAIGKGCLRVRDCAPGAACVNSRCLVATSCKDGKANGEETDVDCGGPACPPCALGKGCGKAGDCATQACLNNRCVALPSCSDKLKNGQETDVDCGGPACARCEAGLVCLQSSDCVNGLCSAGRCALPASCTDGLKNGGERVTGTTGWAASLTVYGLLMMLAVSMAALFPGFIG